MPVRPGFSGWKGYTVSGFRFRVSGKAQVSTRISDSPTPQVGSRQRTIFLDYRLPTTDYRKPETGNRYYVVGHANAVLAGGCSSRLFASTEGDPPSCHS